MNEIEAVKNTVTLTEETQNRIFKQITELADEGGLSFSTRYASIGFYAAFVAVNLPRFNYSVEATIGHLVELDQTWPSAATDSFFGYYEDNEELEADTEDASLDLDRLFIYGGYAFL